MIKITKTEWEGLEGLGDSLLLEIRPDAERAIMQASLILESTIKRKLTGTRSGRVYKVSRTGRMHVASAPGEAPAVLFGNLRMSVGHSKPSWEGFTISQNVGPGLGTSPTDGSPDPGDAYARRLEYGGGNIFARPYMEPSVQEAQDLMDQVFIQFVGSK